MVLHGDELGRTQDGNNNTYAQDSGISWVHWDTADQSLIDFTAALVRLRKEHPTFRRSRFFDGRPVVRGEGEPLPDIVWLQPDAAVMAPKDWDSGFGRAIAVFLNGNGIHGRSARGEAVTDRNFLVLFNAGDDAVDFTLPPDEYSDQWEIVVDTVGEMADSHPRAAGEPISVEGKSLIVLRAHIPTTAEVDHSVAASLSTAPAVPSVTSVPAPSPTPVTPAAPPAASGA
jgi:isoamylase